MEKVITEKSPLTDDDFFYLVDRNKESFTYPLHKHEEMELNFVEHCEGARRIVGDSIETLGRYDLVLLHIIAFSHRSPLGLRWRWQG